MGEVADASAGAGRGDPGGQGALGGADHRDALRRPRVAYDEADGGVGDDPVLGDGEVERQQIAVGERVVVRQPVQHGVVDRGADVVAERAAPEGRLVVDVAGHRSGLDDHGLGPAVDVEQVGADAAATPQRLEDVGDQRACLLRSVELGAAEDLDHAATLGSRRPHRHPPGRVCRIRARPFVDLVCGGRPGCGARGARGPS